MRSLNSFLLFILISLVTQLPLSSLKAQTEKPIPLADPHIMLHNNVYYAYGTHSPDGIEVYSSDDLKTWIKSPKLALHKDDSYADRWFWAPEVYYIKEKNKFYMYYSADEHICVATSDSPLGPFVQDKKAPMRSEKSIDSSLFIDDDGTPYIYFVRFTNGNVIWVAELEKDLVTIKEETLKQCIEASLPWETVMGKVAEGPSILKRDGIYYLLYSANDYQSHDYGVGYATSTSPFGPWKKSENNPIYQKPDSKLVGVGHGAPFTGKDGKLRYVFHAHRSKNNIHPRDMYIADLAFGKGKAPIIKFGNSYQKPIVEENTYQNPVIATSLPDPTIIKAKDGYFYLYATEDIKHTPIYKSKNLTDWDFVGTAFTKATRPTFEPKGGLWAPDINYIDGRYVLYYSMSAWGGEWTCGIGAAVSDKPEGPFTDKGKLFRSNEINVQNSIDQFYIEENGKKYLFWGSFRGIYAVELSKDGLSVKEGAEKKKVAGTAFEGTYIYKRNGYYYFFASIGSCCEGVRSTYKLVVGRSKSLFGPYYDKKGKDMMDNGYSLVIGSNSRFVGNGHCSEIVQDKKGNDWIYYHGIDVNNPHGRILLLDQIKWDNQGWPYIDGNSPSLSAKKPVF